MNQHSHTHFRTCGRTGGTRIMNSDRETGDPTSNRNSATTMSVGAEAISSNGKSVGLIALRSAQQHLLGSCRRCSEGFRSGFVGSGNWHPQSQHVCAGHLGALIGRTPRMQHHPGGSARTAPQTIATILTDQLFMNADYSVRGSLATRKPNSPIPTISTLSERARRLIRRIAHPLNRRTRSPIKIAMTTFRPPRKDPSETPPVPNPTP